MTELSFKEVAMHIIERESGETRVDIAQIYEILSILSDFRYNLEKTSRALELDKMLYDNGKRRSQELVR